MARRGRVGSAPRGGAARDGGARGHRRARRRGGAPTAERERVALGLRGRQRTYGNGRGERSRARGTQLIDRDPGFGRGQLTLLVPSRDSGTALRPRECRSGGPSRPNSTPAPGVPGETLDRWRRTGAGAGEGGTGTTGGRPAERDDLHPNEAPSGSRASQAPDHGSMRPPVGPTREPDASAGDPRLDAGTLGPDRLTASRSIPRHQRPIPAAAARRSGPRRAPAGSRRRQPGHARAWTTDPRDRHPGR